MNTTLAGIIKACSDLENRSHFHELEEGQWVFMGEPSNPIIHLVETCVDDYILIHSSLLKTGEDAMITSSWLGYLRKILMQALLMELVFGQTAKRLIIS